MEAAFAVTPFGETWIREAGDGDFVPTEPGRFAEMLASAGPQFGDVYLERGQEAIRCYGAHAYLACCVMCGAAAEAIVAAAAIAKTGESQRIERDLAARGGRSRLEHLLVGTAPPAIQNEFRSNTNILKYWRDSAAHGNAAKIDDNEAYTSLVILMRFARHVEANWDVLVKGHETP